MQVLLYDISLESCHSPLSNVIMKYTRIPTHRVTISTASIYLHSQLLYSFPIQILTLKMYMVIYGYSESDYIIDKLPYIETDDI